MDSLAFQVLAPSTLLWPVQARSAVLRIAASRQISAFQRSLPLRRRYAFVHPKKFVRRLFCLLLGQAAEIDHRPGRQSAQTSPAENIPRVRQPGIDRNHQRLGVSAAHAVQKPACLSIDLGLPNPGDEQNQRTQGVANNLVSQLLRNINGNSEPRKLKSCENRRQQVRRRQGLEGEVAEQQELVFKSLKERPGLWLRIEQNAGHVGRGEPCKRQRMDTGQCVAAINRIS